MKITRKDIMKAVLSVLTTMLFCGCLCYVTMRYFTTYDGDKGYLTHGMLCFAFLFIDVVLCSFYAARNIRVILIKSQSGEILRNGRKVIRVRWLLSPRIFVSIMVYMIRIVGCSVPMMD